LCPIWSCFHFFGFGNSNCFREQGRQPFRLTPNLEDQVPVFMPRSDMVAQLYPQLLDYHFVAFYDSQGYGGGILKRLHTGKMPPQATWNFASSFCLKTSAFSELDHNNRKFPDTDENCLWCRNFLKQFYSHCMLKLLSIN
jgi:hypothetical protein